MYQLYYYPNSASLAPHFLLHEMRLDYELILVNKKTNQQKSSTYLKLNPAGRIPTLLDGELTLFESPAICVYLCEQHPEKGLIPPLGSKERPLFFQWLAYLNNTLQSDLMLRYYPHRHTTDEGSISAITEAQDERIGNALQLIDDALAGKHYLLGDRISACDFFLFMLAQWALGSKYSPLSFTYLGQYLQRLAQYPTIRAVCQVENINLHAFKQPFK